MARLNALWRLRWQRALFSLFCLHRLKLLPWCFLLHVLALFGSDLVCVSASEIYHAYRVWAACVLTAHTQQAAPCCRLYPALLALCFASKTLFLLVFCVSHAVKRVDCFRFTLAQRHHTCSSRLWTNSLTRQRLDPNVLLMTLRPSLRCWSLFSLCHLESWHMATFAS